MLHRNLRKIGNKIKLWKCQIMFNDAPLVTADKHRISHELNVIYIYIHIYIQTYIHTYRHTDIYIYTVDEHGSYVWLKTKAHFDTNIVITGDTVGCHNDNLRRHQWRQSWHHNDSRSSVCETCNQVLWCRPHFYMWVDIWSKVKRWVNLALYNGLAVKFLTSYAGRV